MKIYRVERAMNPEHLSEVLNTWAKQGWEILTVLVMHNNRFNSAFEIIMFGEFK